MESIVGMHRMEMGITGRFRQRVGRMHELGQRMLTFVKVLDENIYGLVDEDEPIAEPTDRAFWETTRGTKNTLSLTDFSR
jgi:hypothetical protein